MADPKFKSTSVFITYKSSDGVRVEQKASTDTTSRHLRTGDLLGAQHALLEGLEELARLTALFGFEAEALERFNAARQRVVEWKAKRGAA